MSGVTLHYFPLYARAELMRVILKYYGVSFTDHEISMEEWGGLKMSGFTEFGQLPRLDIDGMELVQSHCIYRYLAQKYGAYPSDEGEIYLAESLVDLRDDIFNPVGTMMFKKDFEGVGRFFTEKMPTFLRMIEKRLVDNDREGHFFVGRKVSLADFAMFQFGYDFFCRNGKREQFEHVLQSNAPTFHAFVNYFRNSNENLRRYLETRPDRPL